MSSVQNLKPKLLEILPEKVKSPSTPVPIVLQGAENLYHWALHDKEVLVANGMDPRLIEELQPRSDALRSADGEWYNIRESRTETQKQWKEESPKAYKLRNKLVHDFLFAFRNDEELVGKVRGISQGGGNADMIHDLIKLGIVGREHKEKLEEINFDMSQLDTAIETANRMADLLGAANATPPLEKEAHDLRNRAYTYLYEVIKEIRRYGKFTFYRNHERYKGYVNHYRKRFRRGAKMETAEPVELPEAA